MFRFRTYRLFNLYSNSFHSILIKNKINRNVTTFGISCCSSHSDAFDVSKSVNNKSFDEVREKRINIMKRNLSGDFDVLNEAIIKCGSVEQILELISLHVNVMNNRHLSEVFESLNNLIKSSDNYHQICLKVLSSQQFTQLCNQTVKRIRFFQTSEILTTLKTLVLMNVSLNTTLVQSLLQMTRQMINDFSLREIVFLDFLLNKKFIERPDIPLNETDIENFDSESVDGLKPLKEQTLVPIVEALKLAIPLVLQLKIEAKELDFQDIDLVVKCVRMAAVHSIKTEVVNQLVSVLLLSVENLTVNQMYSIIASLISNTFYTPNINSVSVDRLFRLCLDRVTAQGVAIPDNVPKGFIISLITRTKGRRDFYHKGLYELVANLMIQNPNSFPNGKYSGVLWALTKHSHVHYGLLDCVSDKIAIREPDFLDNYKNSFTNILSAFSLPSNYKPNEPNSEVIFKTILETNHVKYSKQKTRHLLFKILRHLSVLNYYPKQEINEWIDNYLDSAVQSSTIVGLRLEFLETIRIIYQGLCLESDIEDIDRLILKLKPFIEELVSFETKALDHNCKSETLGFALAQGLGGKQFVLNNLFTDFGHHVDHVLVMRKGGYPVSIGNTDQTITHIKQLEVPSDSKTIGIIGLTFRDFCRQPVVRKAETDFRIRTLRKCGITPITINLEGWEALSELEKVPFIMREIQENANFQQKQSNIP